MDWTEIDWKSSEPQKPKVYTCSVSHILTPVTTCHWQGHILDNFLYQMDMGNSD